MVGGVRTLARGCPYWLCWFPAVYFSALQAVFVGSIRYRQPAMLGLIVLAAGVIGGMAKGMESQNVLGHGGLLAIVARLINFCWFVFKWGIGPRVDRSLRWRPSISIAASTRKSAAASRCGWPASIPACASPSAGRPLVKGEGIEMRGLSIFEPGAEGPRAELYSVDECFLRCKTDWSDLLAGEPDVTQVTVRRPTLRATRRPDGTWSAAKLLPLPRLGKRPPLVRIENGTIEIFDPLRSPSSTLLLRDVDATFTPLAEAGAADAISDRRRLTGTLGGDFFRHVVFEGVVDPRRRDFRRGRIDRGAGDFARVAGFPPRRGGRAAARPRGGAGRGRTELPRRLRPRVAQSVGIRRPRAASTAGASTIPASPIR